MLLPCLHHGFGPLRVGCPRTHRDLEHLVLVTLCGIHIEHKAAVDLHQADVIIGRHRPAAVPAFVADAKESHFVGLGMAVGGSLFGESCGRCGSHVLKPLASFLRRAGADVDGHIRRTPDLLDEIHELIGAESIRIDNIAPCRIHGGGTLVARSDSLAPVVLVRKATPGPADVGHIKFPQCRDHVVADSSGIWD